MRKNIYCLFFSLLILTCSSYSMNQKTSTEPQAATTPAPMMVSPAAILCRNMAQETAASAKKFKENKEKRDQEQEALRKKIDKMMQEKTTLHNIAEVVGMLAQGFEMSSKDQAITQQELDELFKKTEAFAKEVEKQIKEEHTCTHHTAAYH